MPWLREFIEPKPETPKDGVEPGKTNPARSSQPMHYRTTISEGNGLDFVISDGSMDRHGTRINPDGWQLSSFKKNPVALFGHRNDFLVGKWENVRVEAGKLLGRLVLAAKGTSDRIDELISLVDQGMLRAVSVGFSVLESGKPGSQFEIERQELLEASLVSIGSNKNALSLARAMNISNETISLAFGEQAEVRRGDVPTIGEHAATKTANEKSTPSGLPSRLGIKSMNLSQRIEDAQGSLNTQRDTLATLNAAESLDLDAIEALTERISVSERTVAALQASEAKIGLGATAPGVAAPAVNRRPLGLVQKETPGFDTLVRAATAFGVAKFSDKPIQRVLDDLYPGQEAPGIMLRTDQTIGTTTVSGWASQIVQTVNQGFMQALIPYSFYPALRSRGQGFSFDGIGTISLPSRTAGGAGGGFVAEGSPIRVGRITTAAVTLTPFKLGVIVPFSRELAKRSTPAIEGLVRQAILEDTAAILDAAIIDTAAASTSRPAGLLNGLSAAASGYGGGDYQAVVADIKALVAPFTTANAADNIVILMNPAQGLSLSMMPGPGAAGEFGWATPLTNRYTIIESTTVPANRLIALRVSDFATAMGDSPDFDVSEQATLHMEDTTPLEIVSGTGPTTADPVRSLFQTATIGVRMLMDVTWKMRRTGMVSWIDTTTW
jgi:HK97 family phage major capsid protein/HK97 family phage prohead protease